MIKDIIMWFVLGAIIFLVIYFCMPIFQYGFVGWSMAIFLLGVIFVIFDFDFEYFDYEASWRSGIGAILISIGVIFTIFLPIGSMPLFRYREYQKLIGNVHEKTFTSDINPTNPSDIIIIDYEIAAKLADKKLVDDNMALGSQVEIGIFTLQKVKNQLYYVAPLNHTGFWKWNNNKSGTPGYMIVNANNDKDIRLISKVNGVDIKLKYQDGAYFGDYLPRYLYTHGYSTTGLTDYSFEVDDDLMPWYVVTKYEKKIGYGGNDATGVVLVNPINGDIKEYNIDDSPAWIDRIQPKEFITTQVNDWGKYIHGVFNWSDKDKRKLSQWQPQLVYGGDGNCYLYSGVTSIGKDDASMGFVMINSRTKETTFYKSTGSVESAIQRSAEQKVSEKGYIASYPRPYNINGIWTYVMALKDKEGLIKSISMVSYENYQIVGVGDNIFDALRNYKSALNSTGNIITIESNNIYLVLKGTVTRIHTVYNANTNYSYFMLKEYSNKLFVTTSTICNEVLVTEVGDKISIKITNDGEGEIFVDVFDNLELMFDKTEKQIVLEKNVSEVKSKKESDDLDRRVNAILENMSSDQKLQIVNDSKR